MCQRGDCALLAAARRSGGPPRNKLRAHAESAGDRSDECGRPRLDQVSTVPHAAPASLRVLRARRWIYATPEKRSASARCPARAHADRACVPPTSSGVRATGLNLFDEPHGIVDETAGGVALRRVADVDQVMRHLLRARRATVSLFRYRARGRRARSPRSRSRRAAARRAAGPSQSCPVPVGPVRHDDRAAPAALISRPRRNS